jgi:hypothetical protein
VARDICCPLEEARAFEGIGLCLARTAYPPEGIAELQQALAIYERMETPDVVHALPTLRSQ